MSEIIIKIYQKCCYKIEISERWTNILEYKDIIFFTGFYFQFLNKFLEILLIICYIEIFLFIILLNSGYFELIYFIL